MIRTTSFLKYLYEQLKQVDENVFLKNTNQSGENVLKHMVVESLIASAKDFSSRVLENTNVDEHKGTCLIINFIKCVNYYVLQGFRKVSLFKKPVLS